MITKVTKDVLDLAIKPIDGGLDINGDGTASFSIDGTVIGANFPAPGDFTNVSATGTITAPNINALAMNAPTGNFDTISHSGSGFVSMSTQLRANPGTAVVPSIVSTGDPNTGIYWDAGNTNELKFANAGGHTWTITATGDFIPNGSKALGSTSARIANIFATNANITNGVTAPTTSATTTLAGLVELATGGEVFGSSTDVAVTPSSLRTGYQLNRVLNTGGGYQIMPSGTVIAWGRLQNVNSGSFVVTLPLVLFSTTSMTVIVNAWSTDRVGGGNQDGHGGLVLSTSQIRIWHSYDGVIDLSWVVLGTVLL